MTIDILIGVISGILLVFMILVSAWSKGRADAIKDFRTHLGDAGDEMGRKGHPYRDYWIDGGDSMECINRKDKRHRESMLAPWLHGRDDLVKGQMNRYQELFADIRHLCLFKLKGNHEDKLLSVYERDVNYELISWIKDGIGDDTIFINGGAHTFFRIIFRANPRNDRSTKQYQNTFTVDIGAGHGYGGGRLEGAGPLSLGRYLKENGVDLAFTGHRHTGAYLQNVQRIIDGGGNIVLKRKYAYQVPPYRGALLNEHTNDNVTVDYSDVQLFPASSVGGVRQVIDLERRELVDPMRAY